MPQNWKAYKLKDVVNYVNGGAWAASCYNESGIPVVRVSDVNNGAVDLSACKYLDSVYADKYVNHRLINDDLIVCTVGSHPDQQSSVVGGIGIVSKEVEGSYLNQNAVLLRSIDSELLDQKWLGYLGKSPIFKNHIENEARGSANQVRIAISNLLLLEFDLPSLPIQRRIASILSSLDDKIELNLEMNKTLEEMAMALYKHWFVDSTIEDIESLPLAEVLDFIVDNRGKTAPTSDSGIPLIATNCVKNLRIYPSFEKVRYIDEETYNNWFRSHPVSGDVLFVNKGAPGSVNLVPDPVDFCIAQDMIALRVKEALISNYYLFAYLRLKSTQDEIKNKSVGTTIPHLKKTDLLKFQIPIPKPDNLKRFTNVVTPIFKKLNLIQIESQTLTTLRETLLPKLISGEIEVLLVILALGSFIYIGVQCLR